MKALPKRKGNHVVEDEARQLLRLNESPSEKEGKSLTSPSLMSSTKGASMKALPKRKGNPAKSP